MGDQEEEADQQGGRHDYIKSGAEVVLWEWARWAENAFWILTKRQAGGLRYVEPATGLRTVMFSSEGNHSCTLESLSFHNQEKSDTKSRASPSKIKNKVQ